MLYFGLGFWKKVVPLPAALLILIRNLKIWCIKRLVLNFYNIRLLFNKIGIDSKVHHNFFMNFFFKLKGKGGQKNFGIEDYSLIYSSFCRLPGK